MGLRVQLLGQFSLEHAGARVDLPTGTQRLAAFLALRGPVHRCHVAGTLWPGVPESQALASLRTGMWRLNRFSPGLLTTNGAGLGLAAGMTVDSRDQETFTTRLLRERVEDRQWITDRVPLLWRPELLPGWYDDWVVFERERLSQLRLRALEYLTGFMARHDDLALALQLAFEAVRAEPLRETANLLLIDVYLAEGNVSDAVHHYEVFRSLLHRELGIEPSRTLSELIPRQRPAVRPSGILRGAPVP